MTLMSFCIQMFRQDSRHGAAAWPIDECVSPFPGISRLSVIPKTSRLYTQLRGQPICRCTWNVKIVWVIFARYFQLTGICDRED